MNLDHICSAIVSCNDIELITQAQSRERSVIITDQDTQIYDLQINPYNLKDPVEVKTFPADEDSIHIRGKRYHNVYILSDIDYTHDNIQDIICGFCAIKGRVQIPSNNQLIINVKRV